jgi:hypothetical protein
MQSEMTSFRLPRHWALLFLLYVTIDFLDPSIPGVFFFETESLFVDGVVQARSADSNNLAAAEPMRFGGTVDRDDEIAGASLRVSARPPVPRQTHWKNLKHDHSASFASSLAPDSSPTPALS